MANPIMINVVADNGKQYLINMSLVEVVEFPSPIANLSANLNVVRVAMQSGTVITLDIGVWTVAIAALYAEFNDNPQPNENVKGQLYIMPSV